MGNLEIVILKMNQLICKCEMTVLSGKSGSLQLEITGSKTVPQQQSHIVNNAL
jgi:hypothetical protein